MFTIFAAETMEGSPITGITSHVCASKPVSRDWNQPERVAK
jgi:hypothetical protein